MSNFKPNRQQLMFLWGGPCVLRGTHAYQLPVGMPSPLEYISNLLSNTAAELDINGAVCSKDGRDILRPGDKLELSPVSPLDKGVLARDCGLSRSSSEDVDQSD